MPFRFEPRNTTSFAIQGLAPLAAVGLTLVLGGLLFAVMGYAPLKTLWAFFIEPVSSVYGVSELLVKAAPLIIIAIGLSIGFRANIWNIGAEGQLTVGAISAAGVGLFFPDQQVSYLLVMMFVAGCLARIIHQSSDFKVAVVA